MEDEGMMALQLHDMSKIQCPFEREGKDWLVVPKIKDEFRWVFTDKAIATEKLDGTNVSVALTKGAVTRILNRKQPVEIFSKGSWRFIEGIYEAVRKGYISTTTKWWEETYGKRGIVEAQIFGELLGPAVQGNPYHLERHLWIPLANIREKYGYNFWGDLVEQNLFWGSDEEIFDVVSKTFEELWSRFKQKRWGHNPDWTKPTRRVSFEESESAAKGIVWHHKETGQMAKLRRSMYLWYPGRRH